MRLTPYLFCPRKQNTHCKYGSQTAEGTVQSRGIWLQAQKESKSYNLRWDHTFLSPSCSTANFTFIWKGNYIKIFPALRKHNPQSGVFKATYWTYIVRFHVLEEGIMNMAVLWVTASKNLQKKKNISEELTVSIISIIISHYIVCFHFPKPIQTRINLKINYIIVF